MDTSVESEISIDLILGVCIKDAHGRVLSQNEICKGICGDHVGEACQGGCMRSYSAPGTAGALIETTVMVHNIQEKPDPCDAVIINTGKNIVTLLFSRGQQIKSEIEMFEKLGLTKAEQSVLLLLLEGLTNKRIANKLFISASTVKTHINNAYKKLPTELKNKIAAQRIK